MKVLRPNFEKRGGLVTVIAQDARTNQVLMVAWTDEAGYLETLRTGLAVYYSTSRNKRWMKGEESGNIQTVLEVLIDCDGDALIYVIEQQGGACHTDALSCFFRTIDAEYGQFLDASITEQEGLPMIEVPAHSRFSNMRTFDAPRQLGLFPHN